MTTDTNKSDTPETDANELEFTLTVGGNHTGIPVDGIWCIADFARKLERERDEERRLHEELLYAVCRKFPNETRHETALRYIRQAEEITDSQIAVTEKP